MAINHDILSMILKMLGVSQLRIETDQPTAKIAIIFQRYGEWHTSEYRLQELIETIEGPSASETARPGGEPDTGRGEHLPSG